jgi:hypothetical protein
MVGRDTPCAPSGGHLTCEHLTTLAAGRGLPALPSVILVGDEVTRLISILVFSQRLLTSSPTFPLTISTRATPP